MTDETPPPFPEGEYAIVEILGHRKFVGRIAEAERFGTKLLAIEPIFDGEFLPMIFVGGGSIYQLTPCTAEIAFSKAPKQRWQLPSVDIRWIGLDLAVNATEDDDEPNGRPF